jgi:MFS family permease
VSSIVSGRLMTRWGRYRPLTIAGALTMAAGMAVLTTLNSGSDPYVVSGAMALIGIGIGAAMPLLTVAVQNAVPLTELGIATSMTDFSRKIGGVFGVSAFGALLNARVAANVTSAADRGIIPRHLAEAEGLLDAPSAILSLAEPVRIAIQDAVADGVALLFRLGLLFAVLAVLLAFRLEERPLRDSLPGLDPAGEGASATGPGDGA